MRLLDARGRDLPVPPQVAGALLDELGSPEDRLWPPAQQWPASRLQVARPLAVGGAAGHGGLDYHIGAYEPGRLLRFVFEPGTGLVGTHEFAVEDRAGGSRLVHRLDCQVEWPLLLALPVLRRQHGALVEDILDRAELALTGRVREPARWSLVVRCANWFHAAAVLRGDLRRPGLHEAGPAARASAVVVPVVLAAVAVLHAAWAAGWRWPGGDDAAFAERVLGSSATSVPPAAATWMVAAGLLAGAGVVTGTAAGPPSRTLRRATWAIAGIFALRGAAGLGAAAATGLGSVYSRLDAAIYSPLCLAIGAGCAAVAGAARSAHTPGSAR